MKKSLLFGVMCLVSQVLWAATDVTIYGYRNYQGELPSAYVAGPAKFSAGNVSDVVLITDQTKLGRIYAGEYVNYRWYAQTTVSGFQSKPENLVEIDMITGERSVIAPASAQLYDMTYDYTTQTMFGILSQGDNLATIDIKTGKVTKIGDFPAYAYAMAIACDLDGTLYMISMQDTLYKVNKETVACEKVGFLGVNVAYTQSMCFDHNTHTLYWQNAGDYNLYTVDLTTGKATQVGKVGKGDSMSSLFIPYINVAKGAPDRVQSKTATADKTGLNKVTVSWTNPSEDAQGNELSELTKVIIYRNGVAIQEIPVTTAEIGKAANWTDETVSAGKYVYNIVCENSKGVGGMDDREMTVYVGLDIPGAVKDFKVVSGNKQGLLTWSIPSEGGTGGYYDSSKLSGYKITRNGISTPVVLDDPSATSYTDASITTWGKYTYTITPFNEAGDGIATTYPEVMITPSDMIIMNNEVREVSDGKFYDTGGPYNDYMNAERVEMTLKPAIPNSALLISFSSFNVESGDYLEVYDGISTSAPLIGKFTGEAVTDQMKKLVPTNPDGAFTFYFYSDVIEHKAGWVADVKCVERKEKDLYAVSVAGTSYPSAEAVSDYEVTVSNLGTSDIAGTDYRIQLIDENNNVLATADGTDIAAMAMKKITVRYTPDTEGKKQIHAHISFDADENTENNDTETMDITIQPKGAVNVIIGTGINNIGMFPACFFDDYSLSEMMVPASQINISSGEIRQISFPVAVTNSYNSMDIKIWITETDKENLTEGNIFASDMKLVFEGKSSLPPGNYDWAFNLDNPYNYSGKNLVVLVSKAGAETNNMGVLFHYTSSPAIMTWSTSNYEPIDPDVPMGEYDYFNMIADMKLLMIDKTDGVEYVRGTGTVAMPNPFSDVIYLKNCHSARVTIMNMSGAVVKDMVVDGGTIDTESLLPGVYFVSVTVNGRTTVQKMIKK
ncbi:T9SS type A sorting domain-containing protein [Barnesiella propionica]|uniref:T9SS type A sorting domain-containing protein n=1 Tax=Barnesiella propionica TaxID=2981781 RepID=UPI0011CCC66D|nr:T9SS type A sorting domain-containing protein [Barnesiella propionica]MCU6769348.1 T9SS type A sorting domain-containing protein [Barnesiella propionica]